MTMHSDYKFSVIRGSIQNAAPAELAITIVQYDKNTFAYRISLDDLNSLPEQKRQDFAYWLVDRKNWASKISGARINIEWDED